MRTGRPKTDNPMSRISFFVPPELMARVKKAAIGRGSISECVRQAIIEWVERVEAQQR